jgi:hypothetical protein
VLVFAQRAIRLNSILAAFDAGRKLIAMRRMRTAVVCVGLLADAMGAAWSTPSTLVFIPSTDVQQPKTWHFGLDTYFTFDRKATGNLVDTGLTYGLPGRIEVGLDHVGGTNDPLMGNIKWQPVAERENAPAIAIGARNLGGRENVLAGNLLYALVSKTFGRSGRFHLGFQHGEENRVGGDNDMFLVGWEKQLNPRWWAAVDYASGDSQFGAISPGVAYTFREHTSVMLGYQFYNNDDRDDTITVQVDINF